MTTTKELVARLKTAVKEATDAREALHAGFLDALRAAAKTWPEYNRIRDEFELDHREAQMLARKNALLPEIITPQ